MSWLVVVTDFVKGTTFFVAVVLSLCLVMIESLSIVTVLKNKQLLLLVG